MKTKCTIELPGDQNDVFPMCEMEKGQIFMVVGGRYDGNIVRMTESGPFIAENLSLPGTKIILEVVE